MTRIEFLETLTRRAKEYRKLTESISRNRHLTGLSEQPATSVVDGVLVDFINFIGVKYGVDYALSVEDLDKEEFQKDVC